MALREEASIYAQWLTLPKSVKQRIKSDKKHPEYDPTFPVTDIDFSKKYKVSQKTLTEWKKDKRVKKMKNDYQRAFASDDLADIIEVMKEEAKMGNEAMIKLYLEYLGELVKKSEVAFNSDQVDIILLSIVDIIQKHVKDPKIVNKISEDIAKLDF